MNEIVLATTARDPFTTYLAGGILIACLIVGLVQRWRRKR
jgi:hypothetical protein